MRITTIREALSLNDGTQLEAVAGTVTNVYQRYDGTTKFGPWSFQSIVLDEGGCAITAKLKNRGVVTEADLLGRRVVISGVYGKKGLAGVKVELDEYEGKTSKILLIGHQALIESADVALSRPDPQPELSPTRAPAPAAAPQRHAEAPAADGMTDAQRVLAARKAGLAVASAEELKAAEEAKRRAMAAAAAPAPGLPAPVIASTPEGLARRLEQLIRLRVMTLNAAAGLALTAEQSGITVTPEHLQAIDSWIAIELARGGYANGISTEGERPSFEDFRKVY